MEVSKLTENLSENGENEGKPDPGKALKGDSANISTFLRGGAEPILTRTECRLQFSIQAHFHRPLH